MKNLVQIVVALCMLAVAGGAWWYFYLQAPAAERRAAAGARRRFAVPVETARVTVGPIERRLTAVGSLRSNESVIIRPEIAGRIAEIRFREGERVEQGQPLVRARRLGLARRGRAGAGRARAQPGQLRARRRPRCSARSAPPRRATRRRAAARRPGGARAGPGAARQDARSRRPSPAWSACARSRSATTSTTARTSSTSSRSTRSRSTSASPRAISARSGPGQRIELGVDAFPGETFTGEVYAIDPLIDASGRSIVLRAHGAQPGRTAAARAVRPRHAGAQRARGRASWCPRRRWCRRARTSSCSRSWTARRRSRRSRSACAARARSRSSRASAPSDVVVTAGQLKLRDGAAGRRPLPPAEA